MRSIPWLRQRLKAALGAALALTLPSCAAAEPFVWSGPDISAAEAVRLFDRVCLKSSPDFLAAGAAFDALGFERFPASHTRVHPVRGIAAVVVPAGDSQAQDIRSCAILVDGLAPQAVQAAAEPVVARTLSDALRHPVRGLTHTVWSQAFPTGEVQIIASDAGGAAYLGVRIDPRPTGGQG